MHGASPHALAKMLTCRTLIQPPWKLSKDYNMIIYFYSMLIIITPLTSSTSLLLLYFSLHEVTQLTDKLYGSNHDRPKIVELPLVRRLRTTNVNG
jgi:hypothetical protein